MQTDFANTYEDSEVCSSTIREDKEREAHLFNQEYSISIILFSL